MIMKNNNVDSRISEEVFCRVNTAYDVERLRHCRIVVVGCGGSRQFIEDMARTGLGEFFLCDRDTISLSNLATQHVAVSEVGRHKVEVLAERVLDINPDARVKILPAMLDDAVDDETIGAAMTGDWGWGAPLATVMAGCTDNFWANSRCARLALKYGVPALQANVYPEGRVVELAFSHSDVTPACIRCATSPRYKEYIENGFVNDVTSEGSNIFATTYLNTMKGLITLGILHHGSGHPRWDGIIKNLRHRNLMQARLHPKIDAGIGTFDHAFAGADKDYIAFGESLWIPVVPDGPDYGGTPCPDCLGTGSLADSMGRWPDTRTAAWL